MKVDKYQQQGTEEEILIEKLMRIYYDKLSINKFKIENDLRNKMILKEKQDMINEKRDFSKLEASLKNAILNSKQLLYRKKIKKVYIKHLLVEEGYLCHTRNLIEEGHFVEDIKKVSCGLCKKLVKLKQLRFKKQK